MGLLRLYLALCVVVQHSNPAFTFICHNARDAVQIFYLISGFYMAHIAYKYESTTEFYASRFLRIFCPYYFVLFFAIIISAVSGVIFGFWGVLWPFMTQHAENGSLGIAVSTLSNLTIFFQDWTFFFRHDSGGTFSFTANFWQSRAPLWKYLVIPQSWTIGIELSFYLFVPWLNKQKNKILFAILLISLLSRIFVYEFFGLKNDPWVYRFFPFEIAIFILGMLSNRFYHDVLKKSVRLRLLAIKTKSDYMFFSCVTIVFFYITKLATDLLAVYIGDNYAKLISYAGWFFFIPVLFHIFRNQRYDRLIGDLSYPVYLCHFFIIMYIRVTLYLLGIKVSYYIIILSIISSLIFSIFMYGFLIVPLDRRRYRLSKAIADRITGRAASMLAKA